MSMKKIKKNWNKKKYRYLAGFFALLMMYQAMSTTLDVIANEVNKVHLADTLGSYYEQDITEEPPLNEETPIAESEPEKIKKEAEVYEEVSSYSADKEILSERSENSKTYQMEDGSYVTELYFEPIHKKEGKDFIEIDNTLEQSRARTNRSEPVYENKDGLYDFAVNGTQMRMENTSGEEVIIDHADADLSVYDVQENVMLYSEAYDNIDMEYRLGGNSVTTTYIFNAVSDDASIGYTVDKGAMKVEETAEALLLKQGNTVLFSMNKPQCVDALGRTSPVTFSYEENDEGLEVILKPDQEWLHSEQRVYPVRMSARTADETKKISVTSGYNRSLEPNVNSKYYDLFVGYEGGYASGLGYAIGITRTYIHVAGLSIGSDKEIVDAKLNLYKKVAYNNQWNTIQVGKTSRYVDPLAVTWNNRPSTTAISTTTIGGNIGWQDFDVTEYIKDIYAGKNKTIELKATNESSAYLPNVFLGEASASNRPRITITYRDAYDVDPNLAIDTFDTEMRIFSILNKGFEALSFDGIAKPDSQVCFELVEQGKNQVLNRECAKSDRYFVDPIYIIKTLADTQTYPKEEVNYTTDYITKARIPQFDTPYEYKVKVQKGSETSTINYRSDAFIKYKVKPGDTLPRISSYYGVTIDEIKADNNLSVNTVKENDILILRFKKNNPKVTADVYTPPLQISVYKAEYVNRGSNCLSGICPVIDPVNSTTGNYYFDGEDFTIQDGEPFTLHRYYNSTGPQLSNMFGNGFTTEIESYTSYDKDGNMLYFVGDGRIYRFAKTSSGYQVKPSDRKTLSMTSGKVTITDLDNGKTYYFDTYGSLQSIKDKSGYTIQIRRDEYGTITSMKAGEKTITFHYNDRKLVSEVVLPGGQKTGYEYDANRNLIKFRDTKGNKEEYRYDKNNFLVSVIDKNGVTSTKNTYDSKGRVIKQTDGNGNVSTIAYQANKTIVTNANGSKDVYAFNANYDTTSITLDGVLDTSYTYDSYRNITSKKDAEGNVTRYTYNKTDLTKASYPDGTSEEYRYDANHNITYHKDREGKITNNTYNGNKLMSSTDNQSGKTSYAYDAKNRVIKEIDPYGAVKTYSYSGNMITAIRYDNGLKETFVYDANGNTLKESDNQGKTIAYVYNANGEMTQKNYFDGSSEQWSYDACGNIKTYKDRIGGITKNTYDKNDNLISSSKGSIKKTSQYNEVNQLIAESDEQGLTTTYTYDAHGNKQSETDAYGNTTAYEYDVNDNLIKTVDAQGNEEINVYENDNLVKSISKEGLVTTYEYDAMNREIKRIDPNGSVVTKEYKGQFLSKETDGKGTQIQHHYDTFGREIKTITTYADKTENVAEKAYDKYGNMISSTINGQTTTYTYDVYNQQLTTTDPLGNTSKKVYDLNGNTVKEIDALGNAVTTVYDAAGNVTASIDANGNKETKTYNKEGLLISETDSQGYTTTYAYNNKGQVIRAIDPYKRTSEYVYDSYGNQIAILYEDVNLETKRYDAYGNEIYVKNTQGETSSVYDRYGRVIEKTNEQTGLTIYTEYDDYGNVVEERDSEGQTTTYEYDAFQRKIKTTDAYGRTEELRYDDRDHIIETKNFDGTTTTNVYDVQGNVIEATDALGNTTKKTYNAMNQVIREEAKGQVTEYAYDAKGHQVAIYDKTQNTQIRYRYDANGNNIETIDAMGNSTKQQYDAKNQVVASIDALGNKSTKEYDAYGNIIKESDPLGHTKQSRYNIYGLLEMEVDERGFETTYEYNDELQLVKATDALGNQAEIEYNDRRQKIKEIDSNGGTTEYEYDSYGRVNKEIAPNGKETIKEYDLLGNVVKEESGQKITVYEYDEWGRLIKTTTNDVVQEENTYNEQNQLIEKKDANGNLSTYTYDKFGNVIHSDEKGSISDKEYDAYGNVIKQIDNKTLQTEYTYDLNHRLIQTKINGVLTLRKEYDANGNETLVTEAGITKKTTYDACNRPITISFPSFEDEDKFVAVQTLEYDETGNIIAITDAFGAKEERKYDANNNVIEETDKNGTKTLYEYDGLNHIIKAQNHEERYVTYTYDEAGDKIAKTINRKTAQYEYDEDHHLIYEEDEYGCTNEYEYDEFGNQIAWEKNDGSTITYTYDALGNKLSEGDITFTYDSRNNLLTAENMEGVVTNTYNAFNQKTSVIDTKGNEVTYVYDDDNNLVEKNYAGTTVTYTYDDLGRIKTVSKENEKIAEYEYNKRNEIINLIQGDITTTKTYDDLGRIKTQRSEKNNEVIYDASYTYDNNDNLIEEIVDGHVNMYTYNAYDELSESVKYIDGEEIKTTYQYDIYGNQITRSSKDGIKTTKYNDKNQIESIVTEEGTAYFTYDSNGNLAKKINEDGRVDYYIYDDLNQLIRLEQGYDSYEYHYDGEKERIEQKYVDTKDYHMEVWYDDREPFTIVTEEVIDDTFLTLREKVKQQKAGICESDKEKTEENSSFEIGHNIWSIDNIVDMIREYLYSQDEVYYKDQEYTEYIVDRNSEFTEVLAENEAIHVYGDGLVESDEETVISGWNNSVIAEVSDDGIKKYDYDDFGNSDDIESGHGYNQEMKDASGLIYLRARYYDPEIMRFIQIDTNYAGEEEDVTSQNRYAYTLNNPYKYVDRDGNSALSILKAGRRSKNTIISRTTTALKKVAGSVSKSIAKSLSKSKTTKSKNISKVVSNVSKVASTTSKVVSQAKSKSKTSTGRGSVSSKKPSTNKNSSSDTKNISANKTTSPIKCPKYIMLVKNVYSLETKTETFGIDTPFIKFLVSFYSRGYHESLAYGDKSAIISFIKDTTSSVDGSGLSIDIAVELLSSLGISVSFSWTEVSINAYARMGYITFKLSGFISLNLIWGTHGIKLTFEYNTGSGYSKGLIIEASAHALVIALVLSQMYATMPSIVQILIKAAESIQKKMPQGVPKFNPGFA